MEDKGDRPDDTSNPPEPKELTNAFEESELYDLTTTLDPAHIICLIRQLLPDTSLRVDDSDQAKECPLGETWQEPQLGLGKAGDPLLGNAAGTAAEDKGVNGADRNPPGNAVMETGREAGGNESRGLGDEELSALQQAEHLGPSRQSSGHACAESSGERDNGMSINRRKRTWDDGRSAEAERDEAGAQQNQQAQEEQSSHEAVGIGVKGQAETLPRDSSEEGHHLHICGDGGGEKDGTQNEGNEDPREEAGCVLWDLAANQSHADFLVEHHILEVLTTILQAPHSNRMREVALGILGNLACHSGPERAMVASMGLVQLIVQQLLVEDPPSLTETCRLLSAGLHSDQSAAWVNALDSEEVLGRIMWMAANTMHAQLLEKSAELLLAMVDGRRDTASPLLPGLLRLGLPELLTDLLTSELTAVTEGESLHGDLVLDIVLQITEALSLSDDCAEQLAANRKLFSLACQVVRVSGKDEIGPSGITAAVLVANLLAEDMGLIHELAHDVVMASRLLALMPGAGDDPGARNALWSILGRMCRRQVSPGHGEDSYALAGMAAVLAEGATLVLEDLEEHRDEDLEEDEDRAQAGHDVSASTSRGLEAKLVTVGNMILIMEQWAKTRGQANGHTGQLLSAVKVACDQLRQFLAVNQPSNAPRAGQETTAKAPPHSQPLEAAS